MPDDGPFRMRLTQVPFWAVVAVGAGVLVWAVPGAIDFLPVAPSAFWAEAVAALIVDIPLFRLLTSEDFRIRSTLSVGFTFAILVQRGVAPAILVQAVAAAVTAIGQRYHRLPAIYMVSRLVCSAAAAGVVAGFIGLRAFANAGGLGGRELLTFAALAAVWLLVSSVLYVIGHTTILATGARAATANMGMVLITGAASVFVVAPLLVATSGWWGLLIALPLMVWNQAARAQRRYERWLVREPVTELLSLKGLLAGVLSITMGRPAVDRSPPPFGLILINVESALGINQALGRGLHEKVIAVAARRLIDAYGDDRVSRISGRDIAIIVPHLTEAKAVDATKAAVTLLEPVINVDDIPFALDPAGGVALAPSHGRDLDTLLIKAELAASQARRERSRATLYIQATTDQTEHRIALLRELHAVLRDSTRHDQITVLYQPQVRIATHELEGVEALMRWTHPQWGRVPTSEVIEAIESTEVMHELTRHVLRSVTAEMRRWDEQGQSFRVSVNVSVQDLYDSDFPRELGDMIRAHGIAPGLLLVEITEGMLISDTDRITDVAHTLAEQGVGVSLDDFGTGYASLQQLRKLPLTEVKVDKSYVRRIVDSQVDMAIVTSVHQLARALDLTVVAEGVENQRTVDALATLPETVGQGWHFGRPMTPDHLRSWRQGHREP